MFLNFLSSRTNESGRAFSRRFLTTLIGFLLFGGALPFSRAQSPYQNFRLPPGLPGTAGPVNANTLAAFLGTASPYNLTNPYLNSGAFNPYLNSGAFNPYLNSGAYNTNQPYIDPVAAGLQATATLITATAQSQVTNQKARVTQQQANQAVIETRRRLVDQARYERLRTATPEEVRVREMEAALKGSNRNPPLTEIWSGEALNSLYDNLAKLRGQASKEPNIDLDEDVLKHVNVTTGTAGNIGLLRDGGRLQWPVSLQRPEYAESRKSLSSLLPIAIHQVTSNHGVDGNLGRDIQASLKSLDDTFKKNINELTPSQYFESLRYLNFLKVGVKALQGDQAADYLNGKYAAKGKTVAELIKYMTENGLKFAPATPGEEGAYRMLHSALVAYYDGISQIPRGH
jgi:hypothetical protein